MAAPLAGPDVLPLPLPQHFHPFTPFQFLALPLFQRNGGHLFHFFPQGKFRIGAQIQKDPGRFPVQRLFFFPQIFPPKAQVDQVFLLQTKADLLPDLPQDSLFRLFSVGDMPPTAMS